MQAYVYGFRRVDMEDQNGGQIKGFSTFLGYVSPGVEGYEVSKVFVSDKLARDCGWSPMAGKVVNVEFTPKGRLASITPVRDK